MSGLFDALRAHGHDPRMMKLYVLGGEGWDRTDQDVGGHFG